MICYHLEIYTTDGLTHNATRQRGIISIHAMADEASTEPKVLHGLLAKAAEKLPQEHEPPHGSD
jgi:hypothetical protein